MTVPVRPPKVKDKKSVIIPRAEDLIYKNNIQDIIITIIIVIIFIII